MYYNYIYLSIHCFNDFFLLLLLLGITTKLSPSIPFYNNSLEAYSYASNTIDTHFFFSGFNIGIFLLIVVSIACNVIPNIFRKKHG